METSRDDVLLDALRDALKRQYHAALAMLRDAVARCPEALWADTAPRNAFWQVAYHAVYFTHFYLHGHAADFVPWEHQRQAQHPDAIPGPPERGSGLPLIPDPYSKEEVLAYVSFCDAFVDGAVDALDLHSEKSGFWWYPISKLEHQLVNVRHLQHHTAQLADRIRAASDEGIKWIGTHPPRRAKKERNA